MLDVIALFGTFNRQHSAIKLTSISGPSELVDGVRTGSLDLAFVAESARTPAAGEALEWQVLVERESLVAVVGKQRRSAGRTRVRLAQLAESGSFVEFRAAGTRLRTTVDDAFAAVRW